MKLPSGYTRRLAVASLSDGAFRLHLSALDFCGEQRTGGHLPSAAAALLPRLPRSWRALAIELVGAGLWEQTETGWRLVEWDELTSPSPEEELSAKRAAAGRKGGLAKASKRLANGLANGLAKPVATDLANAVLPAGNATDPSLSPTPPLPGITSPDLGSSSLSSEISSSSEASGSRPESKRARGASSARKWRRVPAEWSPNERHRELARERGVDFELELERFRDHEFAAAKSDADATFRNWLRSARPTRSVVALPTRVGGENFARLAERAARLEREEREEAARAAQ